MLDIRISLVAMLADKVTILAENAMSVGEIHDDLQTDWDIFKF